MKKGRLLIEFLKVSRLITIFHGSTITRYRPPPQSRQRTIVVRKCTPTRRRSSTIFIFAYGFYSFLNGRFVYATDHLVGELIRFSVYTRGFVSIERLFRLFFFWTTTPIVEREYFVRIERRKKPQTDWACTVYRLIETVRIAQRYHNCQFFSEF